MNICDLIRGFFKFTHLNTEKKKLFHKKYCEFLRYENAFNSMIDYTNLIKMMLKLNILIEREKDSLTHLNTQ
jgi:hypothetical protein